MQVATVLHAVFGIQEEYEFTVEVCDVAVKAALIFTMNAHKVLLDAQMQRQHLQVLPVRNLLGNLSWFIGLSGRK